jgi:hypothetical protein
MNSIMTRLLIGIPVSFLLAASVGLAQTTFGSISGTVSDPSGAVVPRATVTVTNEDTGIVRRVTTGSAGDFNAPDLDVGSYRIHVAATGFAVYERGGLVLSAHQVINLNVSLALASTATVTQVTAAAPIIDTSNATLSGIVTGKGMEQVPLVSRHHADSGFYDFMLLNAGTAQVPVLRQNAVRMRFPRQMVSGIAV